MSSFRDRFFTPGVARAITSPSAILAAGVGAAAGVLIGGPLPAVLLGAGAVAVRVLAAVPRNPRRPGIDPRRLEEPWRTFVVDVLDADQRFEQALAQVRPGPLRERLGEVGRRLDDAVDEAWKTAMAGSNLARGRRAIDSERIAAELRVAREAPVTERSAATIEALQAQLASAERLDHTISDVYDRLRLLDARIDETVTRTIELSVTQDDTEELAGLGDQVSSMVTEMEALRQALQETRTQ